MPTRKSWTRAELALLWVVLILAVCGVGGYLWWDDINAIPAVTVPMPTMPTPNAFDYFTAAGKSVVDGDKVGFAIAPSHPGPATADDHPYSVGQKAVLVAENAAALRIFRAGLVHPYQSPPVRSFSTLLPYYAPDRGLARLLVLKAQVRSARGDHAGAMDTDLDAVQEGEMLPRGGPMIGMLVGLACQAIGRRPAWAEVAHLNAAQAESAARRLERINALHVPFADVLQEEEWETQAGLMEMFRRRDWPKGLYAGTDGDDTQGPNLALQLRLATTPKRTIMSHYTAYMNQSIAQARQPYAAKLPPPPLPTDPVNAMLLPVFHEARLKDVDGETQDALLAVTLALRAYRLEHGAYPATPAALVPTYLFRIPDDPFALDGALRYRLSGTGYVLYSVGPDGKDDGGRPIFDTTQPAPAAGERDRRYWVQEDSTGDIVAGINQS